MHRYWPPLAELVAQLELELGHPCQANAYLTPPGAQGFAVHSDSHDVFVFQTHGIKQWEVHTDGDVDKVRLEPGLSMYLPTGTPHAARAQDRASLHVTIGINQLTWRQLLDQRRGRAPRRHRRRAPARGLPRRPRAAGRRPRRPAGRPRRRRRVPSTPARGRGRPRASASCPVASPAPAAGCATCWRRATSPTPRSCAAATGHPCVLVDRGDTLRVLLGDRYLDVPARLRPALEKIRSPRRHQPGRPAAGRAEPAGAVPPAGPRGPARGPRLTAPFRCATASLGRADPLAGTASTVRAFLLVEHPGPWGADVLRDTRLPDGVGSRLAAAGPGREGAGAVRPPARAPYRRRTAPGSSRRTPTRPRRGPRPPSSTARGGCSTSTWPRSAPAARPASRRTTGRCCASAPTGGTTRAAPSAAVRWPRRWPRPTPTRPGRSRTSGETGSRRTCWCSRTGSTTARSTRRRRSPSPAAT